MYPQQQSAPVQPCAVRGPPNNNHDALTPPAFKTTIRTRPKRKKPVGGHVDDQLHGEEGREDEVERRKEAVQAGPGIWERDKETQVMGGSLIQRGGEGPPLRVAAQGARAKGKCWLG